MFSFNIFFPKQLPLQKALAADPGLGDVLSKIKQAVHMHQFYKLFVHHLLPTFSVLTDIRNPLLKNIMRKLAENLYEQEFLQHKEHIRQYLLMQSQKADVPLTGEECEIIEEVLQHFITDYLEDKPAFLNGSRSIGYSISTRLLTVGHSGSPSYAFLSQIREIMSLTLEEERIAKTFLENPTLSAIFQDHLRLSLFDLAHACKIFLSILSDTNIVNYAELQIIIKEAIVTATEAQYSVSRTFADIKLHTDETRFLNEKTFSPVFSIFNDGVEEEQVKRILEHYIPKVVVEAIDDRELIYQHLMIYTLWKLDVSLLFLIWGAVKNSDGDVFLRALALPHPYYKNIFCALRESEPEKCRQFIDRFISNALRAPNKSILPTMLAYYLIKNDYTESASLLIISRLKIDLLFKVDGNYSVVEILHNSKLDHHFIIDMLQTMTVEEYDAFDASVKNNVPVLLGKNESIERLEKFLLHLNRIESCIAFFAGKLMRVDNVVKKYREIFYYFNSKPWQYPLPKERLLLFLKKDCNNGVADTTTVGCNQILDALQNEMSLINFSLLFYQGNETIIFEEFSLLNLEDKIKIIQSMDLTCLKYLFNGMKEKELLREIPQDLIESIEGRLTCTTNLVGYTLQQCISKADKFFSDFFPLLSRQLPIDYLILDGVVLPQEISEYLRKHIIQSENPSYQGYSVVDAQYPQVRLHDIKYCKTPKCFGTMNIMEIDDYFLRASTMQEQRFLQKLRKTNWTLSANLNIDTFQKNFSLPLNNNVYLLFSFISVKKQLHLHVKCYDADKNTVDKEFNVPFYFDEDGGLNKNLISHPLLFKIFFYAGIFQTIFSQLPGEILDQIKLLLLKDDALRLTLCNYLTPMFFINLFSPDTPQLTEVELQYLKSYVRPKESSITLKQETKADIEKAIDIVDPDLLDRSISSLPSLFFSAIDPDEQLNFIKEISAKSLAKIQALLSEKVPFVHWVVKARKILITLFFHISIGDIHQFLNEAAADSSEKKNLYMIFLILSPNVMRESLLCFNDAIFFLLAQHPSLSIFESSLSLSDNNQQIYEDIKDIVLSNNAADVSKDARMDTIINSYSDGFELYITLVYALILHKIKTLKKSNNTFEIEFILELVRYVKKNKGSYPFLVTPLHLALQHQHWDLSTGLIRNSLLLIESTQQDYLGYSLDASVYLALARLDDKAALTEFNKRDVLPSIPINLSTFQWFFKENISGKVFTLFAENFFKQIFSSPINEGSCISQFTVNGLELVNKDHEVIRTIQLDGKLTTPLLMAKKSRATTQEMQLITILKSNTMSKLISKEPLERLWLSIVHSGDIEMMTILAGPDCNFSHCAKEIIMLTTSKGGQDCFEKFLSLVKDSTRNYGAALLTSALEIMSKKILESTNPGELVNQLIIKRWLELCDVISERSGSLQFIEIITSTPFVIGCFFAFLFTNNFARGMSQYPDLNRENIKNILSIFNMEKNLTERFLTENINNQSSLRFMYALILQDNIFITPRISIALNYFNDQMERGVPITLGFILTIFYKKDLSLISKFKNQVISFFSCAKNQEERCNFFKFLYEIVIFADQAVFDLIFSYSIIPDSIWLRLEFRDFLETIIIFPDKNIHFNYFINKISKKRNDLWWPDQNGNIRWFDIRTLVTSENKDKVPTYLRFYEALISDTFPLDLKVIKDDYGRTLLTENDLLPEELTKSTRFSTRLRLIRDHLIAHSLVRPEVTFLSERGTYSLGGMKIARGIYLNNPDLVKFNGIINHSDFYFIKVKFQLKKSFFPPESMDNCSHGTGEVTALHLAILLGHYAVFPTLIKLGLFDVNPKIRGAKGAELFFTDKSDKYSIIRFALWHGTDDTVLFLLKAALEEYNNMNYFKTILYLLNQWITDFQQEKNRCLLLIEKFCGDYSDRASSLCRSILLSSSQKNWDEGLLKILQQHLTNSQEARKRRRADSVSLWHESHQRSDLDDCEPRAAKRQAFS